jgi:hypothetical protein
MNKIGIEANQCFTSSGIFFATFAVSGVFPLFLSKKNGEDRLRSTATFCGFVSGGCFTAGLIELFSGIELKINLAKNKKLSMATNGNGIIFKF